MSSKEDLKDIKDYYEDLINRVVEDTRAIIGKDDSMDEVEWLDGQYLTVESVYDLEHFTTIGLRDYKTALEYAKENGYGKVVDIGSAYGWAADLFLQEGINYESVDDSLAKYRYKNKQLTSHTGWYPLISVGSDDSRLAISVMSIGWPVYNIDKNWVPTFKKLAEDFETSLVYAPHDTILEVSHLFSSVREFAPSFYELKR